MKLLILITL